MVSKTNIELEPYRRVEVVGELGFVHTSSNSFVDELNSRERNKSSERNNRKRRKARPRQQHIQSTGIDDETGLPVEEAAAFAEVLAVVFVNMKLTILLF